MRSRWQRLAGFYRRGDNELFDDLDLEADYPDSRTAIIDLCQQVSWRSQ